MLYYNLYRYTYWHLSRKITIYSCEFLNVENIVLVRLVTCVGRICIFWIAKSAFSHWQVVVVASRCLLECVTTLDTLDPELARQPLWGYCPVDLNVWYSSKIIAANWVSGSTGQYTKRLIDSLMRCTGYWPSDQLGQAGTSCQSVAPLLDTMISVYQVLAVPRNKCQGVVVSKCSCGMGGGQCCWDMLLVSCM